MRHSAQRVTLVVNEQWRPFYVYRRLEPTEEVICMKEDGVLGAWWIRVDDDGVDGKWADLKARDRPFLKRIEYVTERVGDYDHIRMTVESDDGESDKVCLRFMTREGIKGGVLPAYEKTGAREGIKGGVRPQDETKGGELRSVFEPNPHNITLHRLREIDELLGRLLT